MIGVLFPSLPGIQSTVLQCTQEPWLQVHLSFSVLPVTDNGMLYGHVYPL